MHFSYIDKMTMNYRASLSAIRRKCLALLKKGIDLGVYNFEVLFQIK